MDRKIIDEFETAGAKLRKAITGLEKTDLLWVPPPGAGIGKWSIQQVVMHLMDDEIVWVARMKSIIAEDNPQILGFDESKFAQKLFNEEEDPELAVRIVETNRKQFAIVLRKLPDSAFTRTGRHNDLGAFTLAQGIQWTNEHLDHHCLYISMKRDRLKKPMA
jgi:hypothetical protein